MLILIILLLFIIFASSRTHTSEGEEIGAKFGHIGDYTSIFNYGLSVDGSLRAITRQQSMQHVFLSAPSGSGKTAGIVIPSLLNIMTGNASAVVLDIGGTISEKTSGWVHKKGAGVSIIDFSETSDGINIFDYLNDRDDVERVAQTFIDNSSLSSGSEKYWAAAAQETLVTFMQLCRFHLPTEQRHMYSVLVLVQLYSTNPERVDELFLNAEESLQREYCTLNAIPEKQRLSIISCLATALKVFKSPTVARATSYSTVSIQSFRERKQVLYLSVPLHKLNHLSGLVAVLFSVFFEQFLSDIPQTGSAPVFFLMDELMAYRIPNLEQVFAQGRRFKVSCMAIVQHPEMLKLKYNHAECKTIEHNCYTHIFLSPHAHDLCKSISERLGVRITKTETKEIHQPLMSSSDVRVCKHGLVFMGAEPPLRIHLSLYFNHWLMSGRTKLPPHRSTTKIPFTEPPIPRFQ